MLYVFIIFMYTSNDMLLSILSGIYFAICNLRVTVLWYVTFIALYLCESRSVEVEVSYDANGAFQVCA